MGRNTGGHPSANCNAVHNCTDIFILEKGHCRQHWWVMADKSRGCRRRLLSSANKCKARVIQVIATEAIFPLH